MDDIKKKIIIKQNELREIEERRHSLINDINELKVKCIRLCEHECMQVYDMYDVEFICVKGCGLNCDRSEYVNLYEKNDK